MSSDLAAAQRLSPLYRLDHLGDGVKMLLIHGESDPRVPREHGEAVAAAAARRGLYGAHLTYAGEGHSIRKEPNVLHMWCAPRFQLDVCMQRECESKDLATARSSIRVRVCEVVLCWISVSDFNRAAAVACICRHTIEKFVCSGLGLAAPPALDPALIEGHSCRVHWNSTAGLVQ